MTKTQTTEIKKILKFCETPRKGEDIFKEFKKNTSTAKRNLKKRLYHYRNRQKTPKLKEIKGIVFDSSIFQTIY